MIPSPAHSCPGCGHAILSESLLWEAQPVILNYRFPTPERARDVPRRDMDIRQCVNCGLIFNSTVDLAVIPYDELYENSQSASPVFLEFMRATAQKLNDSYQPGSGVIFEVGCGKGGFLHLICGIAEAKGIGFDTSYEGLEDTEVNGVRFYKRYADVADVPPNTSAIICRHVVEHIPQIGAFMRLLADLSKAGGNSIVYVETPNWEWIVQNECFWDVFYEHCNYFPMPTLRHLAELAGMEILEQRDVFGGQYQALEVRYRGGPSATPVAPGIKEGYALSDFASAVKASHARLQERLESKGAANGWAIWGAGAKGVSLANAFSRIPPTLVVDANPAKQGSFIPGTSIPVVSPADSRLKDIKVVLVANPNYTAEIKAALSSRDLHPEIVELS